MGKVLVVVDMQNDFISGSLGTKEAQAIVPAVVAKIKEYQKNGDRVVYTYDTHEENYLKMCRKTVTIKQHRRQYKNWS